MKDVWIIRRDPGHEILSSSERDPRHEIPNSWGGKSMFGKIHEKPGDTLKYYVLKKENWDFSSNNVICSLQFVLVNEN